MKKYPEYKDSGIEWLGEIPKHWEVKKIKWIADVYGGSTPTSSNEDFWNGKINWVTTDDLGTLNDKYIERSKRKITEAGLNNIGKLLTPVGSLVISNRAPIGHIGILKVNATTNQGCKSIVLKNNVNSNFYYYHLLISKEQLDSLGKGTTFKELSTQSLKDFMISSPPNLEQTAIANFLDHKTQQIDDLIAKKERLIELLKEERTAIINQAVTKGLPTEVRAKAGLDPNVPMKDSGIEWLGKIPEHWDRIRLKHLVKIKITDGPHETPDFFEIGVPFLSAEAIRENVIDFNYARGYISEEQYEIYRRKSEVRKFDVLLCKSGSTTGKSAIVETEQTFAIWSPLAIIRADQRKIMPYFIFHSLQSNKFRVQVEQFWSFGTQPNIGMGTIENLWIAVPTVHEQTSIIDYLNMKVKDIDQQIEMIKKEIELLIEYKTSLINEAVTGKIDVRDYEINHAKE